MPRYIVDQNGDIVFSDGGEGQFDEIESTVQWLLYVTKVLRSFARPTSHD